MAIFYYPDRSSPSTTLPIAPLESFPSSRSEDNSQSHDETPGREIISYDLGPVVGFLELNIKNLSLADKNSLIDFIKNTVNWKEKTFDFTDDQGIQYDSCRFMLARHEFVQTDVQLYAEVIEIRVDPA